MVAGSNPQGVAIFFSFIPCELFLAVFSTIDMHLGK